VRSIIDVLEIKMCASSWYKRQLLLACTGQQNIKKYLSERAADSMELCCNKEYEIKMAAWIPHSDMTDGKKPTVKPSPKAQKSTVLHYG
jgi:hypothetical protein